MRNMKKGLMMKLYEPNYGRKKTEVMFSVGLSERTRSGLTGTLGGH